MASSNGPHFKYDKQCSMNVKKMNSEFIVTLGGEHFLQMWDQMKAT